MGRLIDESTTNEAVRKVLRKYGFSDESTISDEIWDCIENEVITAFDVEAVQTQVCEEIRTVMDTYVGSMPDDIYSELETLEQETVTAIFDACGSYGMRD